MPLEPYPKFDVNKQAVVGHFAFFAVPNPPDIVTHKTQERPGTKKPGQSGEWTCST